MVLLFLGPLLDDLLEGCLCFHCAHIGPPFEQDLCRADFSKLPGFAIGLGNFVNSTVADIDLLHMHRPVWEENCCLKWHRLGPPCGALGNKSEQTSRR